MANRAPDEDLVKASLQGEAAAFGELARRYRPAAFGIAFHNLGDFEAASDAAQEALVKAYVDLSKLRDPAKFRNWVCRITKMTSLAARRKRRFLSVCDADTAQSVNGGTHLAADRERSDKAHEVREALSALPEQDRLALVLHYVDGYSQEEIGGMLGSSTSAIKSKLHRARRRLRKEMLTRVETSLKDSVLEQLELRPLRYSVSEGNCPPEYAEALKVRVTAVFGSSSKVAAGESYLVCGDYTLSEPVVDAMVIAATNATTEGYHEFIASGSGEFALYGHVKDLLPAPNRFLTIRIFPDGGDCSLAVISLEE